MKRQKEQNPIDQHFRDQLQDLEREPSAGVWDKIAEEIPQQKSNKRVLYLRAASVALLLGLSSVWFINENGIFSSEEPSVVNASPKVLPRLQADSPRRVAATPDFAELPPIAQSGTTHKSRDEGKAESRKQKPLPYMATVNEEALDAAHREYYAVNAVALDTSAWNPRVRFTVKLPQEGDLDALDEGKLEKQKKLQEKLWAYTTSQVENLLNGRKPELPKTEARPVLEVNLSNLINN